MYFTRSALIQTLATTALWLGCSGGSVTVDMAPTSTSDMGAPVTPVIPGTPRLDAVLPAKGYTVGGVAMKLSGQDFAPGAVVTFDGVPATQVVVTSSTQITAMLPARLGAFGLVPVVVQNPAGLLATRSDLFSYYATQIDFAALTNKSNGSSGVRNVALGDINDDLGRAASPHQRSCQEIHGRIPA